MEYAGLNALDMFLIVLLFVGGVMGFIRGILPQLFSIVSIWLGLILTMWLYKPFSLHILQGIGMPKIGSDTMAFLILFVVFFNAVRLVIKMLSTPPEERKQKKKSKEDPLAEAAKSARDRFVVGPLNLIGGAILGVLLMALWLAIILGLMQFLLQPNNLTSGGAMTRNLRTSALLPYFNQILAFLALSIKFFVPKNADILNKVLGYIKP